MVPGKPLNPWSRLLLMIVLFTWYVSPPCPNRSTLLSSCVLLTIVMSAPADPDTARSAPTISEVSIVTVPPYIAFTPPSNGSRTPLLRSTRTARDWVRGTPASCAAPEPGPAPYSTLTWSSRAWPPSRRIASQSPAAGKSDAHSAESSHRLSSNLAGQHEHESCLE